MSSDLERQLREEMEHFTADVRMPRGLAARAYRNRRGHRHVTRTASVVAVAAAAATGAALTLTTLLSGSHQPVPAVSAELAAWTVARQADGSIRVTIRELHDPARLQRALRKDGVPASVAFVSHINLTCRYYGHQDLAHKIFFFQTRLIRFHSARRRVFVIVIRPSALPSGAGLQIIDGVGQVRHTRSRTTSAALTGVRVVHASPRCTGS
jgi:hypothetical protein